MKFSEQMLRKRSKGEKKVVEVRRHCSGFTPKSKFTQHSFHYTCNLRIPQFLNTLNWENLSFHHTRQCTESVAPRQFSAHLWPAPCAKWTTRLTRQRSRLVRSFHLASFVSVSPSVMKLKGQEMTWDGLMQRMTRGRCPCHSNHWTNNCQWKMRKKEDVKQDEKKFSKEMNTKLFFFSKNIQQGTWTALFLSWNLFLKNINKTLKSKAGTPTTESTREKLFWHQKRDCVSPLFKHKVLPKRE